MKRHRAQSPRGHGVKTLIYQFWKGEIPGYAKLSRRLFRDYADRHGADHFFEENPTFFTGKYAEYYHALRPVWDEDLLGYDRVIYIDADVFPKADASADIFTLPVNHIGMVEELAQPELRKGRKSPIRHSNDMRWAAFGSAFFHSTPPRLADRSPRVFNSGVIVYTREGMMAARQRFPDIKTYVMAMRLAILPRFYRLDQNYLALPAFGQECSSPRWSSAGTAFWSRAILERITGPGKQSRIPPSFTGRCVTAGKSRNARSSISLKALEACRATFARHASTIFFRTTGRASTGTSLSV